MSPIAANNILAPNPLPLSRFLAFRYAIVGIVLFGRGQERSKEAICSLVSKLRWCSFIFAHVANGDRDWMCGVVACFAFIENHVFGDNSSLDLDGPIGDFCNRVKEMALDATLTVCQ